MFIGAGERIREFVEDSFELAPRILRAAGMKGEKALGELEKRYVDVGVTERTRTSGLGRMGWTL